MKIVKVSTPEQLSAFLSLSNRSIWEEEIANEFFWPLKHQEACRDEEFTQRREWAFALCEQGKFLYWKYLGEVLNTYRLPPEGILQDEVRNLITRVVLRTLFGKELDLSLAQKALKEYDRRIKLTKLKDAQFRVNFVRCFAQHIKNEWDNPSPQSLLAIAKKNFALTEDLIHQIISAFLLSATIQLADSTVHCLLSGENFTQTMAKFPVNKLLTREGENGEIYWLRPEFLKIKTNEGCGRWLFGGGPRKCPAKVFAPKFVEAVVAFYRNHSLHLADVEHKRSLDIEIPFSLTEKPLKSWWKRIKEKSVYWFNVASLGIIIKYRIFWRKWNRPEEYICLI